MQLTVLVSGMTAQSNFITDFIELCGVEYRIQTEWQALPEKLVFRNCNDNERKILIDLCQRYHYSYQDIFGLEETQPYIESGHTCELAVTSIKFYHLRKTENGYEIARMFTTAPRATATWTYDKWEALYKHHKKNGELASDNWYLL
jgi:hypothetical protein